MAWIESHTVLVRHRKLKELARDLRLRPAHAMGHLHALWHTALEQQEDGDLTRWSDELIADASDFPGDAPQYVRLLQQHGWLDDRKLHDWLDYAGLYLTRKYSTSNRQRLIEIWAVHGKTYGSEQPANGKRADSEQLANLPNHTVPTGPNQPKKKAHAGGVEFASLIPPPLETPEFERAWAEWEQHRRETRHPLKQSSAAKQLAWCESVGVARAVSAIDHTILKGWQGLREPDGKRDGTNGRARATPAEQWRKTDYKPG